MDTIIIQPSNRLKHVVKEFWFAHSEGILEKSGRYSIISDGAPGIIFQHGHCGVVVKVDDTCWFYVGDAYYREEFYNSVHPVNEVAKAAADNDELRLKTLNKIRAFLNEKSGIEMFSFHDPKEYISFMNN